MTGFKQNLTVFSFHLVQFSSDLSLQIFQSKKLVGDSCCTVIMQKLVSSFFSPILNTLSSVIQLTNSLRGNREAQGTKKSSLMALVPLFMTLAPYPSLLCYLFRHVARLSSLETCARLSICFIQNAFQKNGCHAQKHRKNQVGWTSPRGRWFVCIFARSSVVVQEVTVPRIYSICPLCTLHLTNVQAEEHPQMSIFMNKNNTTVRVVLPQRKGRWLVTNQSFFVCSPFCCFH